MSLTTLAFRSLRARPARVGLSVLGVALGVAVLFAGLATNAGRRDLGRDHRPRPGRSRGPARRGVRRDRACRPGPSRRSPGRPASRSRRPPSSGAPTSTRSCRPRPALPPPVTVLGIDPTVDGRLHDLVLVAGLGPGRSDRAQRPHHRAPGRPGRAGRRLAGHACRAPATQLTYRVVGIVAGDGPLTGASGRTVIVPLATAQAVFGTSGGQPRRHRPRGGDGPSRRRRRRSTPRLVSEPYVLSSPQDLADRAAGLDHGLPGDDRADRRGRACSPARSSSSTRCR